MIRPLILASLLLAPVAAEARAVFLTRDAVVFAEPSQGARRLGEIAACTPVTTRDSAPGWLAVETNLGTAFIRAIEVQATTARCGNLASDGPGDWAAPTPPAAAPATEAPATEGPTEA
ncbi:MAG: hypothetical protein LCH92_20530 [Proteobacteria bacterium]|nr:hypothetical protein [Pseudomonadota bacterium]